jgi:hypothetical protein
VSDFTFAVFVMVASMIGTLVGLFTAGVIWVLLRDAYHQVEAPRQAELPRAA